MKQHTFAICAYKDSPYLETCIQSLMNQTVKTDIILCTSTPSGFIFGMAEKYGLPVFVREGTSDIRDDWNFAYEKAKSRFVTIAHQDDVYHKRYAEMLLKRAETYRDMTLFTCDYEVIKKGRIQKRDKVELVKVLLRLPLRIPALNHLTWVKKSAIMFGNSICCPACSYNKELLGEPLFVSEYKYALDWDSLLQLAERPGRFICEETPLLGYRVHEEATTKACILDNRREKEEAQMFEKLWPQWFVKLLMYFYKGAYDEYR